MPDFCTCGAQLPPDARFCHKCGKPQYDYPGLTEETAEPTPPPLPAPIQMPLEISFHNGLAVRTGLAMALIAFLPFVFLQSIPFLPAVAAFCAGFLAVFRYSRATGQSLSVRSGARMGWITGIFSFSIVAVLLTFFVVVVATQGKALLDQLQQLRGYQGPFQPKGDQIEAMTKLMQDPASFALSIAGALALSFIVLTALPVLGGALGAKVLAKE